MAFEYAWFTNISNDLVIDFLKSVYIIKGLFILCTWVYLVSWLCFIFFEKSPQKANINEKEI